MNLKAWLDAYHRHAITLQAWLSRFFQSPIRWEVRAEWGTIERRGFYSRREAWFWATRYRRPEGGQALRNWVIGWYDTRDETRPALHHARQGRG